MSSEQEKLMRAERPVENLAVRKSSVIPLHGKKSDIDIELPAFDVEYHAAGFCACCMRGE